MSKRYVWEKWNMTSGAQGKTSYGYVTSKTSDSYPTNGEKNSFWYVYQGEDSIDPTAVSYTETDVVANDTISITITPSSSIKYGGSVYYLIETETDGKRWIQETEASANTIQLTIPDGAISWRVRVHATDKLGFTSPDFIYGNSRYQTTSEVIYPASFNVLPEDKDLGILTSKTLLTYGVYAAESGSFSYTLTIDDEVWEEKTGTTGVNAIIISDDDWNELTGKKHTMKLEITMNSSLITRNYTFKKFDYSYDTLSGVFNGIAGAIRKKRGTSGQIEAKNFPKEILKMTPPTGNEIEAYILATVEYGKSITVKAVDENGNAYQEKSAVGGVTTITVPSTGNYSVTAYRGGTASDTKTVSVTTDAEELNVTLSFIKVNVSVLSGSTVTATSGSTTVTATSEDEKAVLYLPKTGTWTITASNDSYSFTVDGTVSATEYKEYSLTLSFVDTTLNGNSWADIQTIIKNGKAASYWSVGDTKTIKLNGTAGTATYSNLEVKVFILGFDHNSSTEGTNRVHFMIGKIGSTHVAFCDSKYEDVNPSGGYTMTENTGDTCDWYSSYMRNTILNGSTNSFYTILPSDLKAVISTVPKWSPSSGEANHFTRANDTLFIPSYYEVCGYSSAVNYNENGFMKQYDYFKNGNSTYVYKHTDTSTQIWYHTRTLSVSTSTFVAIKGIGNYQTDAERVSFGVRPCFTIA